MSRTKLDMILCPGERPHRKKSSDGKGAVVKPQCERLLAFSDPENRIENLVIPCPGCGNLIEVSQDSENGVIMRIKDKTHLDAVNTVKVVHGE